MTVSAQTYSGVDCVNCNAELLLAHRIEKTGPLEVYQCWQCEHLTQIMAVYNLDLPPLDKPSKVVICWEAETPSVAELKAVRALLPAYRYLPVSEVKRRLSIHRCLELDGLVEGEAQDLMYEAQALGLNARAEVLDQGENNG